MENIHFEWNKLKATINLQKHGIAFEEAKTVFWDENARLIHDAAHSDDEDRFVILGFSESLRMLVVCHCYRGNNEIIRIIAARKATQKEIKQYQDFLK